MCFYQQLRDKWLSLTPDQEKGQRFNVAHWLSRATFDVIGIAGENARGLGSPCANSANYEI